MSCLEMLLLQALLPDLSGVEQVLVSGGWDFAMR